MCRLRRVSRRYILDLMGLRIKSHTCFYFLVGKDISQLLHPFHLIVNSHVLLEMCVQNIASPFDGIKT